MIYYFAKYIVLIICCQVGVQVMAQQHRFLLEITDSTLAPIVNATVNVDNKRWELDFTGKLSIVLPFGTHLLDIKAFGFYTYHDYIAVLSDTLVNITLRHKENLLQEVTVTSSRLISRNQMSTQTIGIEQLKKMPVLLGEVDPIKTITLLPGIKSGGEASAGIYVRGGGPDQN